MENGKHMMPSGKMMSDTEMKKMKKKKMMMKEKEMEKMRNEGMAKKVLKKKGY